MLGAHLTWHLRRAWAPLTFTDETTPTQQKAFELLGIPISVRIV